MLRAVLWNILLADHPTPPQTQDANGRIVIPLHILIVTGSDYLEQRTHCLRVVT